ncbi:conserved hypothetical protein [Vibrio nigripulchritudo MADA3029]|uniref:Imm49 family immunity protein n=1 Tax=Vibrio nigripulchritudo TaxID=28173 RepID=UPI0003B2013A|nr:Imm49 family immunity protein [Vibrio nigripulchritudo]CCN49923.1 conserved hypothetical protein [Vibrio nigripulchritudo MADA3020]CCN56435.1 conserved hypothetical protein [Vibrio nigripulchritudo MADA3021]CCN62072.1 conserved hypothetical protein [Vibrio nigripulchritudo MADA3029]
MIDFNQNHYKRHLESKGWNNSKVEDLCDELHDIDEFFHQTFTPALYQNAVKCDCGQRGSWANSLILGIPDYHSQYLLTYVAECYQMVLRIHRRAGQEVTVSNMGRELTLLAGEDSHINLEFYLTGLCLNTLLGFKEGEKEILDFAFSDFKSAMTSPVPEVCEAFFDLFKAYFANEQDKRVRGVLMDNLYPYLQMGAIEAKSEEFVERYYQFLFMPLYSIVAHSWGYDETDLDTTVKAAMEANYEYYAYFAPQPGQKKGDESLDLYGSEAYIHHHVMAFLAVHYRHTRKTVSFQSDYIPEWVIKGEGPTREEVLANPPVFDLEHVLGNQ